MAERGKDSSQCDSSCGFHLLLSKCSEMEGSPCWHKIVAEWYVKIIFRTKLLVRNLLVRVSTWHTHVCQSRILVSVLAFHWKGLIILTKRLIIVTKKISQSKRNHKYHHVRSFVVPYQCYHSNKLCCKDNLSSDETEKNRSVPDSCSFLISFVPNSFLLTKWCWKEIEE